MPDPSVIKHEGVVQSVEGNVINVALRPITACGSCDAKKACPVLEQGEVKVVEVSCKKPSAYKPGDKVMIVIETRHGIRALFLAYVIPLIMVVSVLFITSHVLKNEAAAGLISLGMLIPYYLLIFLFRHQLKKTFAFHLEDGQ